MMNISVLEYTLHSELLIAIAANKCYSDGSEKVFSDDECQRLIYRLLRDGHLSPFEHASISYQVEGISRACSHQLVRHRLASYTQQSQRYVKLYEEPEWVIPPSLKGDRQFEEYLTNGWAYYRMLLDGGWPAEDARYILPNATPTSIVITMNFRELLHFFELRCCNRAQWEIRNLANEMLSAARLIAPTVFANAGAPCKTCANRCK